MTGKEFYSDEILLQGLQNGDESSFTTIYKKYSAMLFHKAEAILSERFLADDCVHDVFVDLWKRKQELEINNLEAYLKKAVRYRALMLIRSRKVEQKYFKRIAGVTTELILRHPILYKELETIFQDTLRSLPQDQQEIFGLVREQGLSYREIAELKGISIKTVEKKMSLSLHNLRIKLGELLHLFFFQ